MNEKCYRTESFHSVTLPYRCKSYQSQVSQRDKFSFSDNYIYKERVQKKMQNFTKRAGGLTPKLTLLKSLYTVKICSKMDFFNTKMCFGKF